MLNKRWLADQLAKLEAEDGILREASMLDAAVQSRQAHVIGITGPPGAGKSTAINLLVQAWRRQGLTVGVAAVDPSSKTTGGALLGDRNRFDLDPQDQGIMVRSLAARAQLGGLAEAAIGAVHFLAAHVDRLVIETVGVGQSETDITTLADTIVVVVQPASGDSLQFMKAGIMEIPDILAVTKGDLGDIAKRAARDLAMASRSIAVHGEWRPETMILSARKPLPESGVPELADAIERHHQHLMEKGGLHKKRQAQTVQCQEQLLKTWFGRAGLRHLPNIQSGNTPFYNLKNCHGQLEAKLQGGV